MHPISRVLKNSNFFIFVISQTISQFGDKLDYIALVGLIGVFGPEKEPMLLSQLAIFFSLPIIIFGPISGVLVDRWHRKRVMVTCDLLRGFLVCLIPIIFLLIHSIYPVFVIVFFVFLTTLFFNTARLAIIPDIVKKENVLIANSVATFVGRFATFLGMVLGGFIIDWSFWPREVGMEGWQVGFFLDGATFFLSAGFLATITIHLMAHKKKKEMLNEIGGGLRGVLSDFKETFHLLFREETITYVFTSVLILVFAASAIYIYVIPMVQHGMNLGTRGVGILGGVGGVGLLIGALLTGVVGHRYDLKKIIYYNLTTLGIGLLILPLIQAFILLCLFTFIGGLLLSPIFVAQETLLHHEVPDLMRGRIFSSREWILALSFAVFSAVNGTLGSIIEPGLWLKIVGGIIIVSTLINRIRLRKGGEGRY